jgi:hypothetical protein
MSVEHGQNLVIDSGVRGKILTWTLAKQGQKTVVIERSMVGKAHEAFGPDGSLIDVKQQAAIEGLGNTLASFLSKLKN